MASKDQQCMDFKGSKASHTILFQIRTPPTYAKYTAFSIEYLLCGFFHHILMFPFSSDKCIPSGEPCIQKHQIVSTDF